MQPEILAKVGISYISIASLSHYAGKAQHEIPTNPHASGSLMAHNI